MARILPSVPTQPMRTPEAQAPGVQPVQSQTARQYGQLGKGVQQLGEGAAQMGAYMQEQIDDAKVAEATNRFAEVERQALLDPKNGYLAKLGKDAVNSYDGTSELLQQFGDDIEASLDNGVQRSQFRKQRLRRMEQNLDRMASHRLQQSEAWNMAEAKTLMETSIVDYLAAYQEPDNAKGVDDRRKLAHGQAMVQAQALANSAGFGPGSSQRKALMRDVNDRMVKGVVTQYVNMGRALDARDYLAASQASSAVKAELGNDIRVAVTKEEGSNLARELAKDGGSLSDHLTSLEQLFTSGGLEVEDPEAVFKEALERLTSSDKAMQAERARLRTRAWDQVEEYATITGGFLDPAHEKLLRDTGQVDRFNLWKIQGKQSVTTDFGNQALTQFSPQELRQKYSTVDELLDTYGLHLSRDDKNQLVNRWRSGEETPPKLDKAIVYADGLRATLNMTRNQEIDKDLFARWKNSVDREVRELMAKKPGVAEDAFWSEGIKAASKRGFYLDKGGNSFVLDITATPAQLADPTSIYTKLPDGTVIDATTNIDPKTGGTFLKTAESLLNEQAAQEWPAEGSRPAKPKGFVIDSEGNVVSRNTIPAAEVVRMSYTLNVRSDTTRKEANKQIIRDMFRVELQKASGQIETKPGITIYTQGGVDAVHGVALNGLLARRDEWKHFNIPWPEILDAIGEKERVYAAAKKGRQNMNLTWDDVADFFGFK